MLTEWWAYDDCCFVCCCLAKYNKVVCVWYALSSSQIATVLLQFKEFGIGFFSSSCNNNALSCCLDSVFFLFFLFIFRCQRNVYRSIMTIVNAWNRITVNCMTFSTSITFYYKQYIHLKRLIARLLTCSLSQCKVMCPINYFWI